MFPTLAAALLGASALAACTSNGPIKLPPPRPIVVTSGERIRVDTARMDTIYAWLNKENDNIENDPSFLVKGIPAARESMPWQSLSIVGDTVSFQYDRAHPDVTTAFNVYAHLHLMKKLGKLGQWMPQDSTAEGFELERAIVGRMSDVWLLGRAVFDAPAYGPLDELMYAKEAGYLDAYILVGRPQEFAKERADWERNKPGELEAYRTWFKKTFNHDPPGYQAPTGGA
jgi:hypothetical protein